MRLACIWDTEKGINNYLEVAENLMNKFNGKSVYDIRKDAFEYHESRPQYARTIHKGKLKEGVELNELEVAMICDGGCSWFGGSSVLREDKTFTVEICTD